MGHLQTGDFYAHPFGLTYDPSVEVCILPSAAECATGAGAVDVPLFVVVASDGVWDCWRYELFAEHVLTATRGTDGTSLQAVVTAAVDLTIAKAIERCDFFSLLS